ncbi:MAG: GAF domain-containing protein [Sphingobacteriales bacterium]|jgi:GAF domain-containing protein|nr:GAF domain-containing protein [Sphingobacteriales bacterium]
MSESLYIDKRLGKEEIYLQILPQLKALVQDEEDWIANLANTCALLKEAFNWWWVGFYLVKNQELVLGPFQGPIACTRIAKGKGVCGTAWQQQKTIIVPNVHEFPGHIACSSASLSEIVLPIFGSNQEVIGVLDVDSEFLACFDEIDARYLEEVLRILSQSN